MRKSAQLHRAAWLRRTRALTIWAATIATFTTLLIAAVAGSANPTKKVAIVAVSPATAHRRAIRAEERVVALRKRRIWVRRVHTLELARRKRALEAKRTRSRAHTPHVSAPAVAATPQPPPAPAPLPPAAAPVVVSGGS